MPVAVSGRGSSVLLVVVDSQLASGRELVRTILLALSHITGCKVTLCLQVGGVFEAFTVLTHQSFATLSLLVYYSSVDYYFLLRWPPLT